MTALDHPSVLPPGAGLANIFAPLLAALCGAAGIQWFINDVANHGGDTTDMGFAVVIVLPLVPLFALHLLVALILFKAQPALRMWWTVTNTLAAGYLLFMSAVALLGDDQGSPGLRGGSPVV